MYQKYFDRFFLILEEWILKIIKIDNMIKIQNII